MIIQNLSFNPSNTLQVFLYEGFQYTISNVPGYTLQPVSGLGSALSPLYFTQNGNTSYTFAATDLSNNLNSGITPSFTLTTVSGSTVLTSSNSVVVNRGRFLDESNSSLSNNSYVFYKNEAIVPIQLVAPSFTLKTPTSTPALPPGLSFVRDSSSSFRITGIPAVPVPNSNYQIIGAEEDGGKGKTVTTRFNMIISNERLQLDLSGAPIVNNMQIGVPIDARVITAIPPLGSSTVRYTFPAFPNGIVVTDLCGTIQSSPFVPIDPSYTFILTGTPTAAAAYAFANIVSPTPADYVVQASRTVPSPVIENTKSFNFGFAPTVLFDLCGVPELYTNTAFDPSSIFFRAQTYFTTTPIPITSIFSPDLRSDLSLTFDVSTSRAYLVGNPYPQYPEVNSYTIRAIDASLNTRDYSALISVFDDSVTFSSPVGDLCLNYILSRPVNNSKSGYYPSNVQFTATSRSKRPVTLSAPLLNGTGISLSNGLLVGTPSTVLPLSDLVVTGTAAGSGATATKTVKLAILNDQFDICANIPASNFRFTQNVEIVPFQIPVTTLSERTIIGYSQTGLPTGLTINSAGEISGTPTSSSPTSGNVTINASTGYATGSRDFSFNLVPDSMIFVVPKTSYTYQAGDSVGTIDINGVTFSGTTVSNYDLSISPTYGLTVNSSNGILSGTWTTGVPPQDLLPSSCNFAVTATAGTLIGTLPMSFTANPVVANASLFVAYGNPPSSPSFQSWMYYNTTTDVSTFVHVVDASGAYPFTDIQFKNNDPTNNTIVATTFGSPGYLFKGTRLNDLSAIPIGSGEFVEQMSSLAFGSGQNLYAAGTIADPNVGGIYNTVLARSSNLGDSFDFSNATTITGIQSRDFNRTYSNTATALFDPYFKAGVALAYDNNDGVMLAGGSSNASASNVMVRSLDNGSTWTPCTNAFTKECAYFNIEDPTVWIATGSSEYRTTVYVAQTTGSNPPPPTYSTAATTIKYSTDKGVTWYDATGGFNMFGYEIAYANGTWLATGTSAILGTPVIFVPELRYSINGVDWIPVDFPENVFDQAPNMGLSNNVVSNAVAPLRIGSLNFDGTYWNVFVNEQIPENGRVRLYRHDAVSDLDSGWFTVDISGSLTNGEPDVNSNTRFLNLRAPKYLYTGTPPTNIALSIDTNIGNGPTFTSPTTGSFVLYQYMQITPIQISATGTGQVYLFVETADLPPGLSYNRVTNQITGAPARIGTDGVTFYAKDDNGITQLSLNFTVVVPRVIRQQDGAAAYTSLLRQYTEVLGAQNARDNRVLPNQERALGEFMSPEAPDVFTPSNCPC